MYVAYGKIVFVVAFLVSIGGGHREDVVVAGANRSDVRLLLLDGEVLGGLFEGGLRLEEAEHVLLPASRPVLGDDGLGLGIDCI